MSNIDRIAQILENSTKETVANTYNVTMTLADTQYSQVLPDGTKSITYGVQGGVSTDSYRTAFITGKVATPTAPYESLLGDVVVNKDGLNLVGKTLYFASSAAGKVMQIRTYS